MATVTKSNTRMERSVAKQLYIALAVAVVLIVAVILFQSRRVVEANAVAPVTPVTDTQRTMENTSTGNEAVAPATTNEATPASDLNGAAAQDAPATDSPRQ